MLACTAAIGVRVGLLISRRTHWCGCAGGSWKQAHGVLLRSRRMWGFDAVENRRLARSQARRRDRNSLAGLDSVGLALDSELMSGRGVHVQPVLLDLAGAGMIDRHHASLLALAVVIGGREHDRQRVRSR